MTTVDAGAAEAGQEFMGRLVAKANADAAFRRRLETDPAPIFSALGLELAPGVRFVCEPATRETAAAVAARSSEREIHIPIVEPAGELSDDELAQVNGGGVGAGLAHGIGYLAFAFIFAVQGYDANPFKLANEVVKDAWNQPGF